MTRMLDAPKRLRKRAAIARILGLGTATPGHLSQELAAQFAEQRCCDPGNAEQLQFLHRIYSHAGVERRGSVLIDEDDLTCRRSHEFYRPRADTADRGPTTAQRMAVFAKFAPELSERAAGAALSESGIGPDAITHVIPVTCTGFFSPGVDVELVRRLGLSAGVQRVQVGFMGCHGAFNALNAARRIAMADPQARILVCCVELCSLHMAYGFNPQKLVANSLFADGAAAAVVGAGAADESCPIIESSATMLIPDSLDAMTWRIGDHGFEMTLSPQVPQLVRQNLRAWIEPWLVAESAALSDIGSLAIHPGGPKVLSAASDALSYDPQLLWASRRVLAQHGNMSSATVLFVLQELLAAGTHGECLALGFGPGLTAEGMLLAL